MHVVVSRTGGLAGLTRRAELTTDDPDVERLAARAVADGSADPPSGVPDGFHYTITADGRTARCADPHLTDAQRALVSLVLGEGA
ncbi:hypothetical protein QNO07_13010 [Streptomyces sp. 549]|uniref:protealysin inhibitor emfourin n=1 Tax=Streptomyces sp. 549 TaxID=3049076 RepID=UPI0024C2413A|nr:protealysin inhibitor emfourin [Streptomyces sp. 549]MDK1474330.1 hypothetical protein [Streptomyces sp. 549]